MPMKKSTLLAWCAVAFLLALYWDTNGHPPFVAGAVLTVLPVMLMGLSLRWGL